MPMTFDLKKRGICIHLGTVEKVTDEHHFRLVLQGGHCSMCTLRSRRSKSERTKQRTTDWLGPPYELRMK